ncbi:MAG: cyclic pyranopterin monophosphate synthase MoaC [Thermodesulfobacteriota bacterium]
MAKLSHFDEEGRARMVDVGGKPITQREAVASGRVIMKPETIRRIKDKEIEKGDVFAVARVAGIMAAKKTSDLIPMCHPLAIENVEIEFQEDAEKSEVLIRTKVRYTGKTGVEMEALVATATAALTIYDMCKAIDRGMIISDIKLLKKSGGKSGTFVRPEDE